MQNPLQIPQAEGWLRGVRAWSVSPSHVEPAFTAKCLCQSAVPALKLKQKTTAVGRGISRADRETGESKKGIF